MVLTGASSVIANEFQKTFVQGIYLYVFPLVCISFFFLDSVINALQNELLTPIKWGQNIHVINIKLSLHMITDFYKLYALNLNLKFTFYMLVENHEFPS